jgi:hypothetical protein
VSTVNGRAQLTYRDIGCGQTDTLSAAITGATTSATTQIQVLSPDASSLEVGQIIPVDKSIVIWSRRVWAH